MSNNLFDMFKDIIPEMEQEESKEVVKKTTKKKAETKADARKAKNHLLLPATAYIQFHGKVELTCNTFELTPGEKMVSTDIVMNYMQNNYKITNAMDFTFEKNIVFVSNNMIADGDTFDIEEKDFFCFDGFELGLSDIAGTIGYADFLSFLKENDISLDESTKFISKNGVVIPVFNETQGKDIEKGLLSPCTINLYGSYEDLTVSTDEAITRDVLVSKIEEIYTDLKGKVKVCNLSASNNTIGAYFCTGSGSNSKSAETKYDVNTDTVIKFYNNVLTKKMENGKYTQKELCNLLRNEIPECNTPENIDVKYLKKENIIFLLIKSGGRKG